LPHGRSVVTFAFDGVTLTHVPSGAGVGAVVTVTFACPVTELAPTSAAVTRYEDPTVDPAVNNPVDETVPPVADQVTATATGVLGLEVRRPVALNCCAPPTATDDVPGTTTIEVTRPASVVKVQDAFAASAFPAISVAAVVMVAVYCVFNASAALGVNVAVLPATATVPATAVPPVVVRNRKLVAFSVLSCIGSENVTVGAVPIATLVAPLAGVLAAIVGGVASCAADVVKLQNAFAASALPAASLTAVVKVTVYWVLFVRGRFGVSVALLPDALTLAGTLIPPAAERTKLDGVSEEIFIASENVTVGATPTATFVAPFAGVFPTMIGGVTSAPATVENVQLEFAASEFPAASLAAVVTVAVNDVLPAKAEFGVKVAVLPATATLPAITAPPAATSVKLELLSELTDIGSENVTVSALPTATLDAAFAGVNAVTTGAVTSAAAPVVNVQVTSPARAFPARSRAAVVNVTVYCVLGARLTVGAKNVVLPARVIAPAIDAPVPLVTLTEDAFSVAGAIGSEKVADTTEFEGTPVEPAAGVVRTTVGATTSGAGAVTKLQVKFDAMGLPATSFTSREITAVYRVLPLSVFAGRKTAISPSRVTTLATLEPSVPASVNVEPLTVDALTFLENVAVSTVFSGTAVVESPGETETTRGGVASIICTASVRPSPHEERTSAVAAINIRPQRRPKK